MILRINDRIRNRKVDFWNQFSLTLRYDSMASAFSFTGYFNPDNPEHKDLYCIGHYHLATVEHNDELLLTGYILNQGFTDAPKKEPVTIAGYSLPGVLEDCEFPPKVPLQSDGLSLRQIAEKIITPFGLKMIVDPSVSALMDKVYEKSSAGETQKIKDYLTKLSAQRNVIISHTTKGNILFTKAKPKQQPILNYGEVGGAPFTSMELTFNGQAMHSHITVMKQPDKDGGNAGESTIRNPYAPFVYRPTTVIQNSGDDNDTDQAARNILSAELKNMVLKITTDRWEVDGKIIKPNNLITVINPKVYLYKKSTWFIESIDFKGDNKSTVATLNCVLPEVYSGETPKYLFEGINLH